MNGTLHGDTQSISQALDSRVGLIYTESQKTFILSSQYDAPLDSRRRTILDESSLGTWTLLAGSLTDPSDDKSGMEWWGLEVEGQDLVKECEKHGFSNFQSFSQEISSMWSQGLISISPYKPGKWRKAFLNFDAGTQRAISIALVKLDESTTPRLAMELCFKMAARLQHSSTSNLPASTPLSDRSSSRKDFKAAINDTQGEEVAELHAKIAGLKKDLEKTKTLVTLSRGGQLASSNSPTKPRGPLGPQKKAKAASEFTPADYEDDDG